MKQFSLHHEGSHLEVEFDSGPVLWYRVRLIVDGEPVHERAVFWGTTRLRTTEPRPFAVDVSVAFLGPKPPVLHDRGQRIAFDKDS